MIVWINNTKYEGKKNVLKITRIFTHYLSVSPSIQWRYKQSIASRFIHFETWMEARGFYSASLISSTREAGGAETLIKALSRQHYLLWASLSFMSHKPQLKHCYTVTCDCFVAYGRSLSLYRGYVTKPSYICNIYKADNTLLGGVTQFVKSTSWELLHHTWPCHYTQRTIPYINTL